jgi:hypothetical protein
LSHDNGQGKQQNPVFGRAENIIKGSGYREFDLALAPGVAYEYARFLQVLLFIPRDLGVIPIL